MIFEQYPVVIFLCIFHIRHKLENVLMLEIIEYEIDSEFLGEAFLHFKALQRAVSIEIKKNQL